MAFQGRAQQVAFEGLHGFVEAQRVAVGLAAFLEYRQAEGEALGDVAQFAHVARPVVCGQRRQGVPVQFRCATVET